MDKVISLDFWGTLATANPAYTQARTSYLADLFGVEPDEAKAIYSAQKASADRSAEVFGTATTPLVCVKRLLEGRYCKTYDAVKVLDDFEAMVRQHPPLVYEPLIGQVFEMQRYKGYVIGIASNTNFIRGALNEELAGFDWDFSVYSDELGVSKPDPDFFRTVIKRGRAAQEQRKDAVSAIYNFIHIGDNPTCDVKGADRAGMQGWLTKSPEDTLALLETIANGALAAA